ncbi:DSCC1 family protein [Megaselia abdita]
MEVDEEHHEIYQRTLEDVHEILKHAKVDEKTLTPLSQALYYPDEELPDLKLVELDPHLLAQIQEGNTLYFKGALDEKVVLCTDEKTYEVKTAEISNSLLVVPDLKFGQQTSTSPLKSPKNQKGNSSFNNSLNDSTEEDHSNRTLEAKKVKKIFHEYFELKEIKPRYKKIGDLLQLTRYSGPENEFCIDHKLLFTYDELFATTQCSRKEFNEGLRLYRAIELDGFFRMMDYEYEYRIVNQMVQLINENSWGLEHIDRNSTYKSLVGIAPKEIVEGLFEIYTTHSEIIGKYKYREDLVARIVAQNILQPGLKFHIDEFMSTWQEALPEGMSVDESYLRGLGVIDRESSSPYIKSLAAENMPTDIYERLKMLFKIKARWTLDEMSPYMEYFETVTMSVPTLLTKYARTLQVNGVRYFVSKH